MDNRTDPRLIIIQTKWVKSNYTQQDAAKHMHISQSCVSQYLTGTIKINTEIVIKFANLFDLPPSEIDPRLF